MERRATQEGPLELIDSGQFLAAEEIFAEIRTDDPMEMVVRSEVETYFGRLDKAVDILEQVAQRATDLDVAARFSLASGRLSAWRGDFGPARVGLQTGYYFYKYLGDSLGVAQALLGLALISRAHRDLAGASDKLAEALEEVKGRTSKRAEFVRGLVVAEQATVAAEQSDVDGAMELYTEGLKLLKATERGRFYARALVGMAGLKCAIGEGQDSLELYKEANTIFERYFLKQELAQSQLDLARALIRLQRYERAEKLAEESRNMRRGDLVDESTALSVLSVLALKRNETEQAGRHANAAVELAEQSGRLEARARSLTSLGLVRLSEREFKQAADTLASAAELAHSAMESPSASFRPYSPFAQSVELEARIYLAEAYHAFDTRAGRGELVTANSLLNSVEDSWLSDEYARIAAKYEEQIMFTEDNRLVFDGNQLPKWQEAKRTLEGFLLRNALRQTNNSLTRAARKLGVSKVHVHNLKKKHNM